MNNEELKKKMVEIIINAIWKDAEADYDSTDETEAGLIADALIAAGIGDVKDAEIERKAYEVASNQYRIWFEEQKDRAKVAEKALREACSRAWSIECTCPSIFEDNDECSECYKNQSEKRYEEKDAIGCLSKKLLEQAEKELAEEGKDEN